jgi:hypothetical protein
MQLLTSLSPQTRITTQKVNIEDLSLILEQLRGLHSLQHDLNREQQALSQRQQLLCQQQRVICEQCHILSERLRELLENVLDR